MYAARMNFENGFRPKNQLKLQLAVLVFNQHPVVTFHDVFFICGNVQIPAGKEKPAKYIFLKYADGVAKLRAKQAHRLLYRYHL